MVYSTREANIEIAVDALFEQLAENHLTKDAARKTLEGLVWVLTTASCGCRFDVEWDTDTPWSMKYCPKHGG